MSMESGSAKSTGTLPNQTSAQWGDEDEGRIEILPILNLLLKQRRQILKPTAYLIVIVGVITLFLPPSFTATAKFLSSASLGSSHLTLRMGGSSDDGFVDSLPEYYQSLVQSEGFLTSVINRQIDLIKSNKPSPWRDMGFIDEDTVGDAKEVSSLVAFLKARVSIANQKSSSPRATILALTVTTSDRQLSKQIAEDILADLSVYGGDQRNQKATQNRAFVEKRLHDSEIALKSAESELAHFTMHNRKIATPDLETHKDGLERAVKAKEEVYLELLKQLEAAKTKEEENKTVLQVLERPISIKTGPKRVLYLMLTGITGLLFFSGLAYARDRWRRLDRNDTNVREFIANIHDVKADWSVYKRRLHDWMMTVRAMAARRIKRHRNPN